MMLHKLQKYFKSRLHYNIGRLSKGGRKIMKKIIGILIMTLLIVTAFSTVAITNNQILSKIEEFDNSSIIRCPLII